MPAVRDAASLSRWVLLLLEPGAGSIRDQGPWPRGTRNHTI